MRGYIPLFFIVYIYILIINLGGGMSDQYIFSNKSFEYERKIHRELGSFEFVHVKLIDGWDEPNLKNGIDVYLICVDLELNQMEVYIGNETQRDHIIIQGTKYD
jgi:hypothetical protein